MKLFSFYASSAAFRARIALNLKGIEYDYVAINLLAGEQHAATFHRYNAQGLVPALELDSGTTLIQSSAILDWLESTHPNPPLLPSETVARAHVLGLCNIIACDVHPLNNLRVLKYLKRELGANGNQRNAWYAHWISQGFAAIEAQLSDDGPFSMGSQVGLLDVYLVPQVTNAARVSLDMSPYPKIARSVAASRALDAFTRAAPENQPDAPA